MRHPRRLFDQLVTDCDADGISASTPTRMLTGTRSPWRLRRHDADDLRNPAYNRAFRRSLTPGDEMVVVRNDVRSEGCSSTPQPV